MSQGSKEKGDLRAPFRTNRKGKAEFAIVIVLCRRMGKLRRKENWGKVLCMQRVRFRHISPNVLKIYSFTHIGTEIFKKVFLKILFTWMSVLPESVSSPE